MCKEVKTTCPYCGVGCGIIAATGEEGNVTIKGDPDHPANFGRLCSKGTALAETLDLESRLLEPEVYGEKVEWSAALDTVADGFRQVIQKYGPDAVAFYVSGQLLTEDYYAANKLMKGFIGSANIDTNSRLCMSSAVAAYKRAFGTDTVPCSYDDIEQARLITLVGSNTAWCHPVIYQRIALAKKKDPQLKVVVIDPRRTATCELADLHLPLAPGTDAYLFSGLLSWLDGAGVEDKVFTSNHCEGLDGALELAHQVTPTIEAVARLCDLSRDEVEAFYNWFAQTEESLTIYSQGINQSSSGTDKANSIINCHLFSGRIGKPGMGPFSITGQPNAMGGREVGGLSNQLAAHMEIENEDHRELVGRFWQAPNLCTSPGLKAVDLFQAIEEGTVKAVWIMATNPAVSLPDADRVRAALAGCELVVVSDTVERSDTVDLAHVKLPALAWGEKDGTVTNSERRISRQRAFLPQPGSARADWWIISEVAKRLGYAGTFSWQHPAEIFSEYAELTAFENQGDRDLDLGALCGLSGQDYDALVPTLWPCRKDSTGERRLFSDGRFFTPSGKARLIAVNPRGAENKPTSNCPFILNSGRVRDHWHTMTRTGKSPRLSRHIEEPYVEINDQDAKSLGLEEGDVAKLENGLGAALVRVNVGKDQKRGSLFSPIHWSSQNSSAARIDALVYPVTDPHSGQPESKHTPVSIRPLPTRWFGFLLSRRKLDLGGSEYWSSARGDRLWRYHLAGTQSPASWGELSRQWLCTDAENVDWVEYLDQSRGQYRSARFCDGKLDACLYIGAAKLLPDHEWIEPFFLKEALEERERAAILSGRPLQPGHDAGSTVCACFGVGKNTITEIIQSGNAGDVDSITRLTKAGGNCGSCIPELKQLLHETAGENFDLSA